MGWMTDELEKQQRERVRAATEMQQVLAMKEKLNTQSSPTWDRIMAAIKAGIEEFNAGNESAPRLVDNCTPVMVTVHGENEIAAIFTLEIDPTNGRLHYVCRLQGGPGVPLTGDLQIQVGTSEAQIVGKKLSSNTIVRFTPEQVGEFLFSATLFPKRLPAFLNTLPKAS
jgi:hypothetical protein